MARGRMINQTIDYDPEFNALSMEAQLLYLRALAFLDRDGLIVGHPGGLLSKIAPLMESMRPYMQEIINEWVNQELVIRYIHKNIDILFFKGFGKNQSGMHYDRESPSRFDPPPGWTHGPKGLVKIESVPTPPVETDNGGSESSDTPTEPIEDAPIDSGLTPEEVRHESGETPTQIEVKDQDQQELKEKQGDEEEDAQARDPVGVAWLDYYGEPMPAEGKLKTSMDELVIECGPDAVIHGIAAAAKAKSRTFRYIAESARNYLPPPPAQENSNYTKNGNGRYSVDIPGVVAMPPAPVAAVPPLPPPMAHDDPWQVGLDELMRTLPPRAVELLAGSQLVTNGELAGVPFYRVVVMARQDSADWLNRQVGPAIRKKVASVVGHRVEIEIIAAEGELA